MKNRKKHISKERLEEYRKTHFTRPQTGLTREEEFAQCLAEGAAENAKKQQAIEDADPTRQAEKAMIAAETKAALQSRDQLAKICRNVSTMDDFARKDSEMLIDNLGLPQGTPITMQEFESRIKQFVEQSERSGVTFDSDAARKFELYTFVQSRQGTVIDNSTLQAMLERCESLDFGITLPKTEKVITKSELTFDDIAATLSTQSDEGNKALKIAAVDAALTGEVRATWAAFEESLYRNFNGFKLTRKQGELILTVMHERRLNMLKPADYDQVRVSLARTGELPSHLIYPSEQIRIDLETADLSKPEVRREFNRRERQLQGR